MRIEHVALWTHQLEKMKAFYCDYFGFSAGERYSNPNKQFQSYFLSGDSGARLELMANPHVPSNPIDIDSQALGFIHIAISVGDQQAVVALTKQLADDGYCVVSEPRKTGDGYFESCVLDPDNNRIEITI